MRTKSIIIPGDIYKILRQEESFLNRSNIKIYTADSNRKTLSLHNAEKADLIIAKLDGQDMNGEKLCSLIRDNEHLRAVSIIIICPKNRKGIEQSSKCRANSFISMPVDRETLIEESYRLLNIAPRKVCRIPVTLAVKGKSGNNGYKGQAENISSSGIFFRSSAKMVKGDEITCSFPLPGFMHVNTKATIARVVKSKQAIDAGYGVSFTEIPSKAVSAIEVFVNEMRTIGKPL